MGIGHVAVGLGLKKACPSVNAGFLIFAALFLDLLLGVFVLLGIEQVHTPSDFSRRHYLTFVFPYSHGLVASAGWTALAGCLAMLCWRKTRVAVIFGIAILSHFVLDVLVHVPEMPVAGPASYKLGLGLWNHLALELTLEVIMTATGLSIYLKFTKGVDSLGKYGMAVFVTLLTAITVGTQATAASVPAPHALATGWVVQGFAIGGIAFWLDRKRAANLRQG